MRSETEIVRGTWVAVLWTILADSGAVLVGVVGRAILSGDLGDGGQEVLLEMVSALLPSFVAGLYIVAASL